MSMGRLMGSALIAFCLTACGCAAQPRFGPVDGVSPVQLPPRNPMQSADAPPDVPPSVTRFQKPEGDAIKPPEVPPLPEATQANYVVGEPAARVGAIVNNQVVLNEEVLAAAYPGLMAARDLPEPDRTQKRAEIWNQALNALIEREVVLQDAFAKLEKAGKKTAVEKLKQEAGEQFEKTVLRQWMKAGNCKTQEELRDFLKKQGVSLEMQRRLWERHYMVEQYLHARVHPFIEEIGPQQIFDYYDKHPEEFHRPDSVQWQDLFILTSNKRYATPAAARRFAEELAERARNGEDFAKLAEQFDDGDSSFRKGEGIGAKRGEIKPPEVESLLFQLNDGETAVVALERGFHVIRVVHREYEGPTPLDEKTQKQIKEKLANEIAETEMKRLVNKLKHDAIIVYNKGEN
ncbi:MAG TPA: peptidyl-prolyl cis-trans isomerase [Gemmataceae bacterium]|nr:peptidyl-prolyl cis-trans isomerase [Gemmataceae bacterium]